MIFYKKTKALFTGLILIVFYVCYNAYSKSEPPTTKPPLTPAFFTPESERSLRVFEIGDDALHFGGKDFVEYTPSRERTRLLDEAFNHTVDPEEVIRSINFLNLKHDVINADRFGGPENVSIVLIVQVHNRDEYLKLLIDSLQKAKGIERALLVFSHDIYFPPVNALIQAIRFCQVIQIFYPYTNQIFIDRFPGADPSDCEEKITKEQAEQQKCNNWRTPDTYGHYRSAKLTQIKHHWWWKMNYVFDGIMDRYGINSKVLLLEEDHVVAPDVFYALQKVLDARPTICPECRIVSLGLFTRNFNTYLRDVRKIGKQTWFGKHNTGVVLDRDLWAEFRNCSRLFCNFDDYNWDWSLIQISYKCFAHKIVALYTKSPRVLHIGDCGVHTHKCTKQNTANKIHSVFEKVGDAFFPTEMTLTEVFSKVPKISKPNGGWGDTRDHELCHLNTYPVNAPIWDFSRSSAS